jgi:hypothetical protein
MTLLNENLTTVVLSILLTNFVGVELFSNFHDFPLDRKQSCSDVAERTKLDFNRLPDACFPLSLLYLPYNSHRLRACTIPTIDSLTRVIVSNPVPLRSYQHHSVDLLIWLTLEIAGIDGRTEDTSPIDVPTLNFEVFVCFNQNFKSFCLDFL